RYSSSAAVAAALEPFAGGTMHKPSRWRRVFLSMAGLALMATVAAAAGVVRLPAGPDREIVIETDDPQIEVVVKGERIVRIVDPKSGKTYRLDREDLTLSLADEPDGLSVVLDG